MKTLYENTFQIRAFCPVGQLGIRQFHFYINCFSIFLGRYHFVHVNQCPDLGLISFSVCSRPTACTVCSQYPLSQAPVRSNYRARSAESHLNDSSVSQSINTCMSKLTSLSFHYYAVQLKKL